MHDLVELKSIIPTIVLDILYATKNNFTGRAVYPSARCFLRRETAERVGRVQDWLRKRGLGLKVWDGYRPFSVQKIFWEICPKEGFVANPAVGSVHNRGSAVDLTLVDLEGKELKMPTAFDDFSERASRAFRGPGSENREILEEAMGREGFLMYPLEWWHFEDPNWEKYEILDVSFDEL